MVERLTLDEIRARYADPIVSDMTPAERMVQLAAVLEKQRERIEGQSRMIAQLMRWRSGAEPWPDLRSWEEVKAYVDCKM